jgi:nicotinate phosphoribosyltransferase
MEKCSAAGIDLLFNDLYQYTCSYSYFQNNKHQDDATFEVFFRKYPFAGEYVVFAGLEAVRELLDSLVITQQHLDYLKEALPELSQEYLDWIRQDFRHKIRIESFREGSVVFAKEPLITFSGPLSFVQLLETPILNLVGFASLVATNASRMSKAVYPKSCIEFGLRRAQGPNGGLSASIYAYLGGFVGTSNVKASQLYSIPCMGSMSHAFITSFTTLSEVEAFTVNGVDIPARALQIRQ